MIRDPSLQFAQPVLGAMPHRQDEAQPQQQRGQRLRDEAPRRARPFGSAEVGLCGPKAIGGGSQDSTRGLLKGKPKAKLPTWTSPRF